MQSDAIYITAARRTPLGAFLGQFAKLPATILGERVIAALISSPQFDPDRIDEVLMGCVLEAGLGQAPARQAALGAGVPASVPCTTINKVCGSAMKTVMLAHDMIRAGSAQLVIAGGMESMSRAPHLVTQTRQGYKLGHQRMLDHMLHDGLENPYDGRHMGEFAEDLALQMDISREAQDAYAADSTTRALRAAANGEFDQELVEMDDKKDQLPPPPDLVKLAAMRPAFRSNGTITAANASSIADGAAALLLASAATAEELGLPKLAKVVGHVSHAQQPAEFTIAPIGAIRSLLSKIGWQLEDVDLFEINEAFAVVVLAAERELGLDHSRVNVNGGACALGHPIGASGARILVTLVHALRQRGLKRGVACLCIGGGEATAVAVEITD
ncbi:MAG: thiolase family protein [Pseudomonadales bacterium]|jgi:acetyl-CoA C-acetyltransferase